MMLRQFLVLFSQNETFEMSCFLIDPEVTHVKV